MASPALAAFKKLRRQVNFDKTDDSNRSTKHGKKKGKKRTSESEGTVAVPVMSTMSKVNVEEVSCRRKKKGKNKKKDDPKTGCLTAMGPVPLTANICWDPATAVAELLQAGKIDVGGSEEIRAAMREFVKRASQITASGVLSEYTTGLKTFVPEGTTRIAFDANMDKNRYQDVICADRERVQLTDRPNLTDYIHANRVVGKPIPPNRTFICTQGPFLSTITEFWRMVRQESVDSIVMLCETKECGKDKCAQYWPLNAGEVMNIAPVDFVITNKGMYTHEPGLITTVLSLKDAMGFEQRVLHHQWKNWPDRGVPEKTDVTLKLLQLTRPQSPDQRQCTVVHCSAGIGRTGSVVAVEICAQRLLSGKNADVLSLVKHLRSKRMHSIQTDQQYLFVYKCLLALIREHVTDPEMQQAIDFYNGSYDAIVKGGVPPPPPPVLPPPPPPTPVAVSQNLTPPDPFANAPSPFGTTDYAPTSAPLPPTADPNQSGSSTNNNFLSY